MSLIAPYDPSVPTGGFDVRTAGCDAGRASLDLSGHLDADGAAVLAEVIDGHLRAGRRYFRLDLGRVQVLGPEAVAVLTTSHDRLLARHGTLILLRVSPAAEAALRAGAPASPLFVLAPNATEPERD